MKKTIFALALIGGGVLAGLSQASAATYTFVGSWQVFDPAAPVWFGTPPNGPLAYTGTETAALLFGGSPTDYAISTIDNNPLNIDHKSWYDVIGVGGNIFAENYFNKFLGQFYGPTSSYFCCGAAFTNINAASAFVRDNGVLATNFAFKLSTVPVPAAFPLFLGALGGLGAVARRRKRAAV